MFCLFRGHPAVYEGEHGHPHDGHRFQFRFGDQQRGEGDQHVGGGEADQGYLLFPQFLHMFRDPGADAEPGTLHQDVAVQKILCGDGKQDDTQVEEHGGHASLFVRDHGGAEGEEAYEEEQHQVAHDQPAVVILQQAEHPQVLVPDGPDKHKADAVGNDDGQQVLQGLRQRQRALLAARFGQPDLDGHQGDDDGEYRVAEQDHPFNLELLFDLVAGDLFLLVF